MKLSRLFIAILIISLLNQDAFSQFKLSGEFRTRFEYRDGYKTLPTENTNAFMMAGQRTRLIGTYSKDKIESKIVLQDARIWGEDKWKTDNNGIGLFEGWAKYNFSEKLSLKVGRQMLVYDDGRLFASGNWRTYGESHDAALLMFECKENKIKAHFGFSVSNNSSDETAMWLANYELATTQYKNMAFLWINKKLMDDKLNISLFGVRDGYLPEQASPTCDSVQYRNTVGPFVKYSDKKLSLQGSFYMQTGDGIDGKEINANFYNFVAMYNVTKKISIKAGYDHYSGTDMSDASENNTFDNLYGPGHSALGDLDYFGLAKKHKAGVNDIYGGITIKLPMKMKFMMNVHNFALDQEYLANGTKVDKALGTELDFIIAKKFNENFNIKAGLATMSPTESMEMLKGITPGESETPMFGWLMFTFTPEFL